MNEVVDQKAVSAVVDGFKMFYNHVIETKKFDVIELKNFMEPIFKKAGYRNVEPTRRGGLIYLLFTTQQQAILLQCPLLYVKFAAFILQHT